MDNNATLPDEPDVSPSTQPVNSEAGYMESHPYADMFPRMQGKDFLDLVASIERSGLKEPIVIYEGKILDGRNRYAACAEAKVEPDTVEYEDDDPLEFVLRKNLYRRQLQASQRAIVAARLGNLGNGQHASQKCEAITLAQAAETLNVSPRSVDNARAVLASGNDELIEAVESGKTSVSAAAAKVKRATAPTSTPPTVAKKESRKLLNLWNKTGDEGRALFLEATGLGYQISGTDE